MAKLNNAAGVSRVGIGEDGLLRLIDEVNAMRARSGQRQRFTPERNKDGVLQMVERYEVWRPRPADTPSPRHHRPQHEGAGYD